MQLTIGLAHSRPYTNLTIICLIVINVISNGKQFDRMYSITQIDQIWPKWFIGLIRAMIVYGISKLLVLLLELFNQSNPPIK
jgi:hypothetical protein